MHTVLLYSAYTDQMSYFDDWIDAFKDHSVFNAECINTYNAANKKDIFKKIEAADVVVLHHSMNGDTLAYLVPFMSALKQRRGKLVSFVGNEVNLPILGMKSKIDALRLMEPNIIATQLLQEAGEWLYSDCITAKVLSLPHALNPKAFFPSSNPGRTIDIGTRSSRYGVYIGDNDRNAILQFFYCHAKELGLTIDLGFDKNTQKRFNRSQWADFLSRCTATLSTEAGSFYLQKDDQLVNDIQNFLKEKSKKIVLPRESVLRHMYRTFIPLQLRKIVRSLFAERFVEFHELDHEQHFDDIQKNFFLNTPKCPIYSKAISSRHFDAIGTKTLHIMYPGRYNDLLTPGVHYFELKRDHSNKDELTQLLRNTWAVKAITDYAYDYVKATHTHQHRLDTLLQALS